MLELILTFFFILLNTFKNYFYSGIDSSESCISCEAVSTV